MASCLSGALGRKPQCGVPPPARSCKASELSSQLGWAGSCEAGEGSFFFGCIVDGITDPGNLKFGSEVGFF